MFAAYSAFAPEPEAPPEHIVIDALRIQSLEQSFEAAWKRPPTASEKQGLIDDFLIEEVFYREAQNLGLDRDDVVIRRRMRQKIEFLLQDGISRTVPPERELRAFFEKDSARYANPDRVSFRQVYLGDGNTTGEQADILLAQLNGGDPQETKNLGERTMLPETMTSAAASEIDATFGRGFGEQLLNLPTGNWSGPIRSGFGAHLILVEDVIPAPVVTFEQARSDIVRDFQYDQQRDATKALVERLKQNYEIIFDEGTK